MPSSSSEKQQKSVGSTSLGKQLLAPMRYKDFVWPNNPYECSYKSNKSYVEHKYAELLGIELEDMEVSTIVISGIGEFVGSSAYSNWRQLVNAHESYGVGDFFHPIFTNATQGLMINLSGNMEPREQYIKYSFDIVIHRPPGWVITDVPEDAISSDSPISSGGGSTSTGGSSQSGSKIVVGDVVTVNGYAYYDSNGSNPRTAMLSGKYTVTYVNYNGTHPVHIGSLGWMKLSDVSLQGSSSPSSGSSSETYTVKSGDTLSKIASMYNTTYQLIAKYNNIKNPNMILVGQVINIPPTGYTG